MDIVNTLPLESNRETKITLIAFVLFLFVGYFSISATLCIGAPQNGKRFTFRQSKYILRTSSILGGDTVWKIK